MRDRNSRQREQLMQKHRASMFGKPDRIYYCRSRRTELEKETRQEPGHGVLYEVLWVAGALKCLKQNNMVMFTVFKNHSFLFLIIKFVVFLVENLESIEMHLYTYTHPKLCNVYNKLGYLSLYVFFNIFIKRRGQVFFRNRLFPQKLNRVIK